MKRLIFYVCLTVLVAGGVFSVSVPSAQGTVDEVAELQAQIQALLAQVQQLQAQLAQLGGGPAQWCHTFNTNLRVGDFDFGELGDIYALHEALIKEGFSFQGKQTLGGQRSFDEETASVVVAFQQKYRSEILTPNGLQFGTGFVGPSTRAKLNSLYGCGIVIPPPQASITVLSPNGGEELSEGQQFEIRWAASNIPSSNLFTIDLRDENGQAIWEIARYLPAPQRSYKWNIDLPSRSLIGDKYKIEVRTWQTLPASVQDESDNYFSIVASSTVSNLPPVVDGVSGPTQLNVGQTGTWTVKAHDPENGTLSYSVSWGDEVSIALPVQPLQAIVQTTTFTHVYSKPGTYNVQFSVSDGSQWAYSSISVVVGSVTTPSITVLSPNGGEVLQTGQKYTIRWNSSGVDNIYFSLVSGGKEFGTSVPIPASNGQVEWTVPDMSGWFKDGVSPNNFKIFIYNNSSVNGASDYSDGTFTIISRATPSITVLSPNGGERLEVGKNYTVRWSSKGVDKVAINIIDYSCSSELSKEIAGGIPATQGSYSWTIPSNFFESTSSIHCPPYVYNSIDHYGWKSGDSFKIFVAELKDGPPQTYGVQDQSDNYFSIVASSTTPTTPAAPEMVYPVNGQVLNYGAPHGYFFKVKPIAGATEYRFRFYQSGTGQLLYDNFNNPSMNGEFTLLPGQEGYSSLKEGATQVSVTALVNGVWSQARTIIITLRKP